MAIDSINKRKSAAGVSQYYVPVHIEPDGTQPAAWRANAGWSYYGIAPGAPTVFDRRYIVRTIAGQYIRFTVDGSDDSVTSP